MKPSIKICFYLIICIFINVINISANVPSDSEVFVKPTIRKTRENNNLVSNIIPVNADGTEVSEAFLKTIETYINSLQTITGDFKQNSSNGATDSGKFYISKPGRIRLEYNSPILLVSDGNSLVYQDKSLDQISYMSIKSNPAAVVLNSNITITGPKPTARVKNVTRTENNMIEISLATITDKHSGTITLIFEDKPLSLYGWRVRDVHGIVTTVQLSNIKPAAKFNDNLFKITRSKPIGKRKSRSKYY